MAPREEPETVYPSRKGELTAAAPSTSLASGCRRPTAARRDSGRRRPPRPIGWGAWRAASTSAPPRGTPASRRSRSACSTRSAARPRGSGCSGRSRARPTSATTCSSCCSSTTASTSTTTTASASPTTTCTTTRMPRSSRIVERYKAVEARVRRRRHPRLRLHRCRQPRPSSRYNARIAANLGAPVLLVLGGRAQAEPRALGRADARTPTTCASSPSSRSPSCARARDAARASS